MIKYKQFENLKQQNIKTYIDVKNIKPNKGDMFIYHATDKELDKFFLDSSLDWEDVDGNNSWDFNMPSGYIFLTDSIEEAKFYGKYIIPFEINGSVYKVKVNSNNPSSVFDDDYNYSGKIWKEFEESMDDILEIKGFNKSTFVANIDSIIPRIDIAKDFYHTIERKSTHL